MTTYTYTTLNDPLATAGTFAQGINDAGQIVGYYLNNGGSTPQGLLYSGGTYTTIDDPLTVGEPATFAQGINDAGQIVGYFAMGGVYNGFLYSGGTYTTINDPLGTLSNAAVGINAMGQIVGDYTGSGIGNGYLYSGGNFITIMPLSASDVTGINDAGQIVGVYDDSSGNQHGFLDSSGSYTTIDDPLASAVKGGTVPFGINNADQIVGYYYDSSGGIHGFLESGGSYTTIDYPLAKSTFVTGINNAGQIVGWYDDGSGHGNASYHGFLANPEPVAEPDRAHVQENHTVTADAAHGVLANDTDPVPNDTLSVSAIDGQAANVGHALTGSYGALTLNADGSYSYLANHGSLPLPAGVGIDTFSYTAADGAGGTATSTLTVVVTSPGQTYVGGTSGTTIQGGSGLYVLDGGAGNDTLNAATGQGAVLIGGPGDTLNGADSGKDTFVFTGDFGQNTINNYIGKANGNYDVIQLDHNEFESLTAVMNNTKQVGSNTVIFDPLNHADFITLIGVQASSLHFDASHFVLT